MKSFVKTSTIALMVIAASLTISACNKKIEQKPMSQSQTGSSQNASTHTSIAATIEIKNFAFPPTSVKVKPQETVMVINRDSVGHTFTSDNGSSFDTGIINKDESKTITAPIQPGTYEFHCTPHPNMKGTLIVE